MKRAWATVLGRRWAMIAALGAAIAAVAVVAIDATRNTGGDLGSGARESPAVPAPRSVALALAELLERNFVAPETGRRYAAGLRSRAGSGAYDGLRDRRRLAVTLTSDLQAIAPDGHLAVFASRPLPMNPPPAGSPPPVEAARWLAPGIAYVRPTVFSGSARALADIRQFLAAHGRARTLIIDMRVHRGGGLAETDEIFASLFARPTRLAILETRASAGEGPFGPGPTLRRIAGPAGTIRLEHWAVPPPGGGALRNARVYVLVSAFTMSAGEHFVFVLQHSGRATLIGETTYGAGNYGGLRSIPGGMAAFVPVGRTFDPETGEGWEGTGVSPDVRVPAPQALAEALIRTGLTPAEARRLAETAAPSAAMARRIQILLRATRPSRISAAGGGASRAA